MRAEDEWIEGSGFRPPATVALACALVGAGAAVIAIGTPVLKLPGRTQLSMGMQILKALLGLVAVGTGVGLYALQDWSRNAARLLILVGGVLLPLYPLETRFIDWEFLTTARLMVVLTSLVALGYLSRASVAYALDHGGVPARFEGFYCASCNAPCSPPAASSRPPQGAREAVPEEGCEHCGGPIFRLYRSLGGVAYAREVGDPEA